MKNGEQAKHPRPKIENSEHKVLGQLCVKLHTKFKFTTQFPVLTNFGSGLEHNSFVVST